MVRDPGVSAVADLQVLDRAAEHVGLVAQHGQVPDRLASVGEHHRQVHRDAAGIVPGPTRPQPVQSVTEGAGQRGGIGQIRQQT
ncbi:hypothetical protein BIV25_14670 [Streptomyces sp. MUSC 14]|nr:hypothetical protein BIV25_14670 [Streptomyces sp. MUSC 14]